MAGCRDRPRRVIGLKVATTLTRGAPRPCCWSTCCRRRPRVTRGVFRRGGEDFEGGRVAAVTRGRQVRAEGATKRLCCRRGFGLVLPRTTNGRRKLWGMVVSSLSAPRRHSAAETDYDPKARSLQALIVSVASLTPRRPEHRRRQMGAGCRPPHRPSMPAHLPVTLLDGNIAVLGENLPPPHQPVDHRLYDHLRASS